MPKILVADDNSNIQKMVGLALRDQGIDVVAVGNGEAAVRKISDVHPDLVLADVFMPVRNGYEVCQYVKGDSTLAHIPVILLVGAFDPLDEQEAQRVGADGVLKKPFVPPDPLISMVKSALARAGVSVGSGPQPVMKEEPIRVAEMLTPRTLPSVSTLTSVEPIPPAESEPIQEGISSRPEPVRIDAGSQPLAFGSLLETPATEQEQENELGYATAARPELERDWKSGEEHVEEEEVEEEKDSASWRRDGGDDSIDEEESSSSPVRDWRETAFSDAPARKSRGESWTPQKEISTMEEAAEAEESVSSVITEAPVAETKLAPAPVVPFAPAAATPFAQDAWAEALNPKTEAKPATVEVPPMEAQKEQATEEVVHSEAVMAPVEALPAEPPMPQREKPSVANAWFSAVSSPWDAEVEKANQLASTWDMPTEKAPVNGEPEKAPAAEPAQPANEDTAATVDTLPMAESADGPVNVESVALPAATVEAIREETHQVTDTVMMQVPVAGGPGSGPEPAKTSQPRMEDLVAKVLAQMSPEVLQAVTREILKPVVEAMVREELNAKN